MVTSQATASTSSHPWAFGELSASEASDARRIAAEGAGASGNGRKSQSGSTKGSPLATPSPALAPSPSTSLAKAQPTLLNGMHRAPSPSSSSPSPATPAVAMPASPPPARQRNASVSSASSSTSRPAAAQQPNGHKSPQPLSSPRSSLSAASASRIPDATMRNMRWSRFPSRPAPEWAPAVTVWEKARPPPVINLVTFVPLIPPPVASRHPQASPTASPPPQPPPLSTPSSPAPPSVSSPPSSAASPKPKPTPRSWADLVRKNTPGASTAASTSAATSVAPSVVGDGAPGAEGGHGGQAAPLTELRGLVNSGNLCFANAVFQVLLFCAPFYNLLSAVGRDLAHDFANRTPLLDATIIFLREFRVLGKDEAKEGELQIGDPFEPQHVYDAMKQYKRFDQIQRGHQEDAEEFLGFFLDTLHEELLLILSRLRTRPPASLASLLPCPSASSAASSRSTSAHPDERELARPVSPPPGGDDGWLEVGAKNKTVVTRSTETRESPISRIFGGKLRSVLRTPGQKDSVTLEPYQPLQLDIQPDSVRTIEDALRNLAQPETIHDVFSPSRGGLVDATKQVTIDILPPILVLHLKRFLYDNVGGVQKSHKVVGYGTELVVPQEVLSPARRGREVRYRLIGVVYHHGKSSASGHYTVDVLRQDHASWVHIDDVAMESVAPEQVAVPPGGPAGLALPDRVAYLLLWARV